MTLDQIIEQSDELLHNGLENSPTDALRLVHYLAKWLKQRERAAAIREAAASEPDPRFTTPEGLE